MKYILKIYQEIKVTYLSLVISSLDMSGDDTNNTSFLAFSRILIWTFKSSNLENRLWVL